MAGLQIDHIVYATADVEGAARDLTTRLGVQPAPGGRHVGMGTCNQLLSLGGGSYLEVIGPDPTQEIPEGQPLPFGIDALTGPRLVGFAVKAPGIDEVVARARAAGYDPGDVREMQRATPDGGVLRWKLTMGGSHDGLVPFLIDWLDSPHPSDNSPGGCTLRALQGIHPEPASVRSAWQALGFETELAGGAAPELVATIDTPNGRLELR
jgi:hypothetical protein